MVQDPKEKVPALVAEWVAAEENLIKMIPRYLEEDKAGVRSPARASTGKGDKIGIPVYSIPGLLS